MKCSKQPCKKKAHSRGLCQAHYWHFRKDQPGKVRRYEMHGVKDKRTYSIWKLMKKRCYNPKSSRYARYGGRGISVCDAWRDSFDAFNRDMGNSPAGMAIDRIDNDKGYSKDNCRWVTALENNRNRGSNKLSIEIAKDIRTSVMSVMQLAAKYKVDRSTINNVRTGKTWRQE